MRQLAGEGCGPIVIAAATPGARGVTRDSGGSSGPLRRLVRPREEVSGQIGEALIMVIALVTALLNLTAGVLRVRETLGGRDRRVVGGRHRR